MGKYTTEVRTICESIAGEKSPVGYRSVNTIIAESRGEIFDFDYPCFDAEYKPVLETKILKHYYTREICEETYGLWKLRLDSRLNEIMPYYNQLYASTLISFNPLLDVDLTTEHNESKTGVTNTQSDGNSVRNKGTTNQLSESVDEVKNRSGDNTSVISGSENNSVSEKSKDNFEKTGNQSGVTEGNNVTNVSNETIEKDNNERMQNNSGITYSNDTTHADREETRSSDYNSENNRIGNSESVSEKKNDNTEWDLFSDTPQGGIDGFANDNPSAPTGLEDKLYLTTARKVTDDGTEKVKNSENNYETSNEANTATDHTVNVDDGVNNTNTNNEEINISTDNSVRTNNENGSNTTSSKENSENNYFENSVGDSDKNVNENISRNQNSNDNYNEVNVNNLGRNMNEDERVNENINNYKNETKVRNNSEEYFQRISGKSGGNSYSALLQEFRDTFINIDEMIIEELSDLFFGLW